MTEPVCSWTDEHLEQMGFRIYSILTKAKEALENAQQDFKAAEVAATVAGRARDAAERRAKEADRAFEAARRKAEGRSSNADSQKQ